ncbi:MAG: alpha-ketoacid dehydrogenase subunit beta [Verrucomicrobiaceae bacterium]|nr:alpha-ketoacid dehydrogenase subunit beta [Verrucomicrobiaceae bacterium]
MAERIISYAEAIREATHQEMARDESVITFGLGVDDFKGIYGTTKGLLEAFGPDRLFDTPLSEDAMTGVAIGAAMAGLRPIHVHIRMDFLLLTVNQLINIAAKTRYMYGGTLKCPLVVRSIIGKSWGQGAQHSQGLHSLFMHVPGLKVVAPSTPHDAKGCLIQAIRDDNPVMFVEHRLLHLFHGHVPEEEYTTPFGKARMLAPGKDITMVGISYMAADCLRAKHLLDQTGIQAEVIDPISLVPFDYDAVVTSVRKTKRLLVVDTAWLTCGAAAEIITGVLERLNPGEHIEIKRLGFAPTSCPPTKVLEDAFYPDPASIALTAYAMCNDGKTDWKPDYKEEKEIAEFRGPF